MKRILISLAVILLNIPFTNAQSTSISMNADGSGHILIEAPGGSQKSYRLSKSAMDFTLSNSIGTFLDSGSRGEMTYSRFLGNDAEVSAYHSALGMSDAQIALLTQRQFEVYDATKDAEHLEYDKLANFDNLSAEEISSMELSLVETMKNHSDAHQKAIHEVLSSEQIQRLNEIELAQSSDLSNDISSQFPNLKAFEVLDLSDDQKEKLEALRQEIVEVNKELFMDEIAALREFAGELLKSYGHSFDDQNLSTDEMLQKVLENLPEEEKQKINKKVEEFCEKQRAKNDKAAVNARIMERITSLLTPNQRALYSQIKDKWSMRIEQLKAEWIKRQEELKPDDSWKDSWKPGDPVPAGAVPPRPKRKPFPLGM